jgi:hypothetical protein
MFKHRDGCTFVGRSVALSAHRDVDLFGPVLRSAAKVVAFGELHGVRDLWIDQFQLVQPCLEQGLSTLVLLERGIDEQEHIDRWLATGTPAADYIEQFHTPTTVGFLEGPYRLLEALARAGSAGATLEVLCYDMVFKKDPQGVSRQDAGRMEEILRQHDDEDAFDSAREAFMIDVLARESDRLRTAERVLLFAGAMHASKSNHYITRDHPPQHHIPTLANWLSERESTVAIYYYPVAGAIRQHSDEGALHIRKLAAPKNILAALDVPNRKCLMSSHALPDHPEKAQWVASFDFLLVHQTCLPDRPVKVFPGLSHASQARSLQRR